jgi:hypothetical protein
MPRTKLTARKAVGGKAPRRYYSIPRKQLATKAARTNTNDAALSSASKRKNADDTTELSGIKSKMWTFNLDVLADKLGDRFYCNLADDDYYKSMRFLSDSDHDELNSISNSGSENIRNFTISKTKIADDLKGGMLGIENHLNQFSNFKLTNSRNSILESVW